jgi:release factor glutamine methyltransferase
VDKNVLIPRPETEMLVEKALKIGANLGKKRGWVLDLCCGSGNIAISLAKLGSFEKLYACDISQAALDISKSNACEHKVNISFIKSDLFSNLGGLKFDIIASNPPYISRQERQKLEAELFFEPEIALFAPDEGLFFYKQIAKQAKERLNENGHILLELNANKASEIERIFSQKGYENLEIIKDYAGLDRILWIKS